MDILLFIIGLFLLILPKYDWVLAIIVLLSSNFLQLPLGERYLNFLFPHNISDFGLLLYIFFFIRIAYAYGINLRSSLAKIINIFFLFLIISGIYDVISGVGLGDVVRYLRNWIYLSIIYIAPHINIKDIDKSLRIIYNITICFCLIILLQRFTALNILDVRFDQGRGTKPPSYSIIAAALCLINVWNFSLSKRIMHLIIFLAPMILNLKMTYVISVFGIYIIYVLFISKWSFARKIGIFIFSVVLVSIIFVSSNAFSTRFINMTQELNTIENAEVSGNFSYRLLHAHERLNYILNDPIRILRGIGFVSESNFQQSVFNLGQYSSVTDDVAQLDTGDIAWSLLFIRLGIAGTFLYICFYFKLIFEYKRYLYSNKYSVLFISLLLVFILFTSLGNALIAQSDFFIYPLLFTQYKNENSTLYI